MAELEGMWDVMQEDYPLGGVDLQQDEEDGGENADLQSMCTHAY